MKKDRVPEVLAPAGNFDVFLTAIKYGADAVYLGGKDLNLRAKAKGFDWDELKRATDIAHKNNKRVYFCLNAFLRERDISKAKDILFRLKEIEVDALIASDPGTVLLAKKIVPHIPIHLSTQANTMNSLSVSFWKEVGIKRINLARELSHIEIYKIRKKAPDIELECFVHGAMCLSFSGRCLLSEYLNQRHANLGLCTQPCRYEYKIKEIVLEEKTRPNISLWRLVEEDGYTKILSCEDLCLVKFIRWFVKNRIDGLKIEGRTKTSSYVGPVVDVYKTAIKDVLNENFRVDLYLKELLKTTTRDFSTGFFLYPKKLTIPFETNKKSYPIIAKIIKREKEDKWSVEVRYRWSCEEPFEILLPGLKRLVLDSKEYVLERVDGTKTDILHSGESGYLRCESNLLEEGILLRKAI